MSHHQWISLINIEGGGDKTDNTGPDPAAEEGQGETADPAAEGESDKPAVEDSDKSRSSSENDFEVIKKDELTAS